MPHTKKKIFYGWRIVATCFVVNFFVFGISVNTFTVYVKPLEADLGWSRAQISMAITLAALAMGAAAPLIGKLVDLTALEYRTLEYLMQHQGEVVSKSELTEHIYDQDFDRDSNVIEVLINRLRGKLTPDLITTRRGLGYQLKGPKADG